MSEPMEKDRKRITLEFTRGTSGLWFVTATNPPSIFIAHQNIDAILDDLPAILRQWLARANGGTGTMTTPRPATVVDYDAWNKGYIPPSEHVLIDELAYRGARVVLASSLSREHQMWFVVKGPPMTSKQRKMLRDIMAIWFEDEPEPTAGGHGETPSKEPK